MSKPKTKRWLSFFDEIKDLGAGGNADVYLVTEKTSGCQYALKELRNRNEEKKSRFISEIQIAKENSAIIPGIIPVIADDCENYWYTMPIAQPVMEFINEKNLQEIVNGVLQLCETLEQLHDKRIHHRDIKPSNIYYYEGRFSLGDFGLVDFPDNDDFTRSDQGLGAIFTIAPEMKRNPKVADASKADVFSLAKTLWMFLSGDEKGFDGVYNHLDESHSLRYVSRFKDEHLVEIDELLKDSTNNDPNLRPDIHMFKERLLSWSEIANDFDKSQNSDWMFLTQQLFGENVPGSSVWREIDKIVAVLNIIGRTPAYNHMLLSDHGGLDFSYAIRAAEENCIYLYDTLGICYLVKPKSLQYEGFSEDYRWSYFRLDLKKLTPIICKYDKIDYEYLVEDVPGHYVDASYVQYGVYDYDSGKPLPEGYKEVKSYLEGSFLFVLKNGPYNHISGTYDGRHGMFESDEFREYIEKLIKMYLALFEKASCDERFKELSREEIDRMILESSYFNQNPFKTTDKDNEEKKKMEDARALIKKRLAFIKENYKEWNFFNAFCLTTEYPERPIRFFFEFRESSGDNIFDLINNKQKCICRDGLIKEVTVGNFEECAFVNNREEAVEILGNIAKIFEEYLNNEGLTAVDDYHQCFSISFRRHGIPSHLFEKSEIETAMRNADDRHNNQLVVDEDGYVKIISDNKDGMLYPVRLECWNAGNNYVGKFSKLCTLDEDYKYCLHGWLRYLKTGRKQYMDYLTEEIEEDSLISQIKEFYNK